MTFTETVQNAEIKKKFLRLYAPNSLVWNATIGL